MKNKTVLITGGGSGIGKAAAHLFAEKGHTVYIVGRRGALLEETAASHPGRIIPLRGDVADAGDRAKIAGAVGEPLGALIHNAAILGPITDTLSIPEEEWRRVMEINLNAPLFLTQQLLPALREARVLHISSGAAHYPIASWGAYCASKAALNMMYRILREEHSRPGLRFGSLRPGIVDTEMQAHIRGGDRRRFPHLEKFHQFYKEGALVPAGEVAAFIYWVVTATDDALFEAEEWDIRDERYIDKWKTK